MAAAKARSGDVKVGDEFGRELVCDSYRPIYYAAASGDFNPIHIDPEVGRNAGLGGAILHGMCTLAWVVETAVGFVGDPTRVRKVKLRFTRPVGIQDSIHIRGRVTSVEGGRMVAELTALNQRGEEVVKGAVVEAELG